MDAIFQITDLPTLERLQQQLHEHIQTLKREEHIRALDTIVQGWAKPLYVWSNTVSALISLTSLTAAPSTFVEDFKGIPVPTIYNYFKFRVPTLETMTIPITMAKYYLLPENNVHSKIWNSFLAFMGKKMLNPQAELPPCVIYGANTDVVHMILKKLFSPIVSHIVFVDEFDSKPLLKYSNRVLIVNSKQVWTLLSPSSDNKSFIISCIYAANHWEPSDTNLFNTFKDEDEFAANVFQKMFIRAEDTMSSFNTKHLRRWYTQFCEEYGIPTLFTEQVVEKLRMIVGQYRSNDAGAKTPVYTGIRCKYESDMIKFFEEFTDDCIVFQTEEQSKTQVLWTIPYQELIEAFEEWFMLNRNDHFYRPSLKDIRTYCMAVFPSYPGMFGTHRIKYCALRGKNWYVMLQEYLSIPGNPKMANEFVDWVHKQYPTMEQWEPNLNEIQELMTR